MKINKRKAEKCLIYEYDGYDILICLNFKNIGKWCMRPDNLYNKQMEEGGLDLSDLKNDKEKILNDIIKKIKSTFKKKDLFYVKDITIRLEQVGYNWDSWEIIGKTNNVETTLDKLFNIVLKKEFNENNN